MGANTSTWACNYLSRAAGWLVAATAMISPAAGQTSPISGRVAGDGAMKMSLPGVYEGYSRPSYGVIKTSQYVPSFDGTLLAIDVYRPALNGKPAPGRFPVILENTRYQRSRSSPARGKTNFVEHGYVFVALDQRASGASFGTRRADYAPDENRDTKHVIEWLAMQPWSIGRVGMIGNSYKGITQFLAAGQSPKGLAALTPTVASFDAYNRTHPNGVWIPQDFVRAHTRPMDLGLAPHDGPLAVDDDVDSRALARAREEHTGNAYPPDYLIADMLRDTVDRRLGYAPGIESSGTTYLDAIAAQKLPIYQTAAGTTVP